MMKNDRIKNAVGCFSPTPALDPEESVFKYTTEEVLPNWGDRYSLPSDGVEKDHTLRVHPKDGGAMKEQADRYNQGKPQYSLLDFQCLEPGVRALEYGAIKYSRNNWRKGMPQSKLIDSLIRHLDALIRGEKIDTESGVSHIGHIQANAMFLGNKNNKEDI